MAKKRKRQLSEPERQLWQKVADTVTPLRPESINPTKRAEMPVRSVALPLKPEKNVSKPATRQLADRAMLEQLVSGKPVSIAPVSPLRKPAGQIAPPTRHIEPRLRKRITRGREQISQTLDLHGMRQDEARHALHHFLLHSTANGARTVLVITGKGRSTRRDLASLTQSEAVGDGILRRMVPQWLHQAPFSTLVSGISDADRQHGGTGALYVRLKRKTGENLGQRRR